MKLREYDSYREMRAEHQKRVDEFPIVFIFGMVGEEKLKELLKPIGAKTLQECVSISAGGLIHKDKEAAFREMFELEEAEIKQFLSSEEHLVDAIYCEMCDHEYSYTWEPDDTLRSLDRTVADITNPGIFKTAWEKAEQKIREE